MRRTFFTALTVLASVLLLMIGSTTGMAQTRQIGFHCASKTEGQQLIDNRMEYYASLSQNDLDWRMRKTNATLEEFKEYAKNQVLDFTQDEQSFMKRVVDYVEKRLSEIGCRLPFPTDIAIVKTTMNEEGGAGGYTSGTVIYLGGSGLERLASKTSDGQLLRMGNLLIHEMFHCLTRNNPDFRRSMYNLIGFTVLDHDINFPSSVKERIMSNPDVERLDNFIEVTIDGKKRPCELIVRYSKTWEEVSAAGNKNASFFNHNECVLIPLDDLNKAYPVNDVEDFWDQVGRNTRYVFAPEECLADNFSYAILSYGEDFKFQSPELIENIIDLLKSKYGNHKR
ncbi:MAG: hypothetical protein K6E52_00850 [Bacteroidaceae bacterium]|nr:hypothetical protein [Bacteroidaceae bacterium]